MTLYNNASSWVTDGTLHSRVDPSTVRNIFTTAFVVLNYLIMLVGGYFLKRRNQRRLILRKGRQSKTVPFTLLTPWLTLGSTATYVWKLRTLPGGLCGLLMLATGVFGLLHQYVVNSFILPEVQPSWCQFQSGIVTTANTLEVIPSPSWPAALLVFQAHSALAANGGVNGVYDKLNFNISSFQPTSADVLGSWQCTIASETPIQANDYTNKAAVTSYLSQQNFLSPDTETIAGAVDANNGSYQGFLAWSASGTDLAESGIVRATIANGLEGDSPQVAINIECNLERTLSSWTPAVISANATLQAWANIMFGFVSEIPVSRYSTQVSTILNAIIMLAGSGNQNHRRLDAGANSQYGCVTEGTQIYLTVYVIFLFLMALLLVLLVADLYSLIRYRYNKRHGLVEEIPTDLISWQLAMVRRATGIKKLKQKELPNYSYVYSDVTGDFEFMKTNVTVCAPRP